jgi:histone acetyltransferase HTATIP
MLVDVATSVYNDQFPHMDGGLRRAVVIQINSRLPAVVGDESAWADLSGDKTLLKALHVYQCDLGHGVGNHHISTPEYTLTRVARTVGQQAAAFQELEAERIRG